MAKTKGATESTKLYVHVKKSAAGATQTWTNGTRKWKRFTLQLLVQIFPSPSSPLPLSLTLSIRTFPGLFLVFSCTFHRFGKVYAGTAGT